jgi:hypothetical protein
MRRLPWPSCSSPPQDPPTRPSNRTEMHYRTDVTTERSMLTPNRAIHPYGAYLGVVTSPTIERQNTQVCASDCTTQNGKFIDIYRVDGLLILAQVSPRRRGARCIVGSPTNHLTSRADLP